MNDGYDVCEWSPGDVASLTWYGHDKYVGIGIRLAENWASASSPTGVVPDSMIHDARRLVVIDPEDAAQVERLAWLLAEESDQPVSYTALAAAVRDYANQTPRIEEPRGLGAVVVDAEGNRWVRTDGPATRGTVWRSAGRFVMFHDINAVRVLSEGIS